MTNLVELEEKVLELERYKRQEEQDRARDLAQRKRELLTARRQLQTEIKRTNAEVRQKTAEVEALEHVVINTQEQEERAIERQMRSNLGFQNKCAQLEARSSERTQLLQDRMVELGLARGRLAHLQMALRTLDEDLSLPAEFEETIQALEGSNADASQRRQAKGPELTAALQKEAASLHEEEDRLARENDMLQEELKEVQRIFELGEKAYKVPQALEPFGLSSTMSRATTRATSGVASPPPSQPRSALSPGVLSSASSTVKLYSARPGSLPQGGSIAAPAQAAVSYTGPLPVVPSYAAPGSLLTPSSTTKPWVWPGLAPAAVAH